MRRLSARSAVITTERIIMTMEMGAAMTIIMTMRIAAVMTMAIITIMPVTFMTSIAAIPMGRSRANWPVPAAGRGA